MHCHDRRRAPAAPRGVDAEGTGGSRTGWRCVPRNRAVDGGFRVLRGTHSGRKLHRDRRVRFILPGKASSRHLAAQSSAICLDTLGRHRCVPYHRRPWRLSESEAHPLTIKLRMLGAGWSICQRCRGIGWRTPTMWWLSVRRWMLRYRAMLTFMAASATKLPSPYITYHG